MSEAATKYYIVDEPRHAWRDEVLLRLNELVRLPRGWDGYSAEPVSFANAQFALRMLETIAAPDAPLQVTPSHTAAVPSPEIQRQFADRPPFEYSTRSAACHRPRGQGLVRSCS